MSSASPNMVTAKAESVIPVYRPDLSGNERAYVLECVDTGWISSLGSFVGRFEERLRQVTGAGDVLTVSNGTVALHLAIHCLGIGPGDEVIVPTFTYIASVNTIAQTGATPVFADCRASDWLVDPEDVERRITPRTKAIMAVHLYGAVCDMPALRRIADKHGLKLIEDAAEALGSTLDGRQTGTFGDVATFSFFGNKTVTTGEGGAVLTNDLALAKRLRIVKGQGMSPSRRYWHEELGFNYRMTNIQAAIGLAQMERLEAILARKREIAARYRALLAEAPVTFQHPVAGTVSSEWLVSALLPTGTDREALMAFLSGRGIETRPVFYCAHVMPMYAGLKSEGLETSLDIAARGLSLPSFPALSEVELQRVADALKAALAEQSRR